MIDRIVDAANIVELRRGSPRFFKNMFQGRFQNDSETLDKKFIDVVLPYLADCTVHMFGIDSIGRLHNFNTDNPKILIGYNMTIEDQGWEQTDISSKQYGNIRYVDVDYKKGDQTLKLIAKIKEKMYNNSNNKL
ncbi:MAG: hypothetical protein ACP5OA_04025 [Candidatus Woesearchaeota archaeon]